MRYVGTMITQEARTRSTRREASRAILQKPAVAASDTAKPSPWILNRWRDLLLFVGTPILLIPVFAAAQARCSAQDIFLFVGAFGAMGHHLPGMIRAYGDRALFQRFRTRFIIAPVALLAVCIWSSFYNIQAVQLVALAWGIWHGMMQTYGFCRIYDAKSGGKAAAVRVRILRCVSAGSWPRCYFHHFGFVVRWSCITTAVGQSSRSG